MSSAKCSACGATFDSNSRFCGRCGATRAAPVGVGAHVAADAAFRPGATLLASPPSVDVPRPVAPPAAGPSPMSPPPVLRQPAAEAPRAPVGAPHAEFSRPAPQFAMPPAVAPQPPPGPAPSFSKRTGDTVRLRPRVVAGIALALFLVGVLAVLIALFATKRVVAVAHFETGKPVIEVRASGVDDGTTCRSLGSVGVFRGGRALLEVDPGHLRVGVNEFVVVVGESEYDVVVTLPWFGHLDPTALADDPPTLALTVYAARTATVMVDGALVPLDVVGRGRAAFPARTDGQSDEHVADVRIVGPDGTAHERIYLRADPAELEVRSPPTTFTTDRASLELDALVAPSATVTLDGRALVSQDAGRVRATLALPREGDFQFRLDVVQPGRRRRTERFAVRRVGDLVAAAATFAARPDLTFATVQAGPDAQRGEPVDIYGTVAHVRIEAGRSYLELQALPCASVGSCALWVEYPAVTPVHVGDTVRVRGSVRGTARYRTDGTQERIGPAVDAAFVTDESPYP